MTKYLPEVDARQFGEIGEHARIVQAELATAQGRGFITSVEEPDPSGIHPSLPGFRSLSPGAATLDSVEPVRSTANHIRFLEHAVERLAAQVAEMAERLAARDVD